MKKLKTVPWKRGIKLTDLEVGTMVTGVPVNHNMFRLAFERGLKLCKGNWQQWKRVNEMLQYEKKLPIYYCLDCGQIEDGRHRIVAAKVYGTKKLSIILWARCYSKNREAMQTLDNQIISGEISL